MHGFSMLVGALVKTGYDKFCNERTKGGEAEVNAVESEPITEVHCVGPSYSHDMEACLDPDWMNKPRRRPEMVARRIR